jgi:hypothetical protein
MHERTQLLQARAAAAVDHVAELLRTEPVLEPVLVVPNYSKVEALGVVADSALKSIRMPDLSEMCRLPRPVAPIATMVKGTYVYIRVLLCVRSIKAAYCIAVQ